MAASLHTGAGIAGMAATQSPTLQLGSADSRVFSLRKSGQSTDSRPQGLPQLSFGRHECPTPAYDRRESAQALPRRRVVRARAAKEDESTSQETPTISSPPPPPPPAVDKKAAAKAEIQKGQTTAIITGVISVLLAVGYLVLLQLLDTRGVNLVPPPPEAFVP